MKYIKTYESEDYYQHPNMKKYQEGDIVVYKNPTTKKRKIGTLQDTIFQNKFIIDPIDGKTDGFVIFGGEEIPASYVFRLAKDFEIDAIKYNM